MSVDWCLDFRWVVVVFALPGHKITDRLLVCASSKLYNLCSPWVYSSQGWSIIGTSVILRHVCSCLGALTVTHVHTQPVQVWVAHFCIVADGATSTHLLLYLLLQDPSSYWRWKAPAGLCSTTGSRTQRTAPYLRNRRQGKRRS